MHGLTRNKLEDTQFINYVCDHDVVFLYETECRNARNSYMNALSSFKRLKCAETRYDMCTKKTIYKRLIRKKKTSG